ncbi:hypothetical protein ACFXG4_51750 [Nocardia sp. NPDC059246]|uniref:hypothetical protein n=1 Tax=unclassified Nocardia TaxID=2637762 RepID=UPI003689BD83
MAIFSSADQVYRHFGPYLEALMVDPVIGPKFAAAKTSFRVSYSDPDTVFVLDATQNPAVVTMGDAARELPAEVELSMSADDGHGFWLGKVNIPMAVARRKVKVDGPVTKLLGMLPAIAPAFGEYRGYCEKHPVGVGA